MRGRGLIVGTVLLAALGGGIWYSNRVEEQKAAKPPEDATRKITTIAEADITKLELRPRDGAPAIVVREGAQWKLTAPQPWAADQQEVGALVSTLASLPAEKIVEEKTADFSSFGLTAPAFEVGVTTKNGKSTKVLVGNETPTGGNFYARVAGEPRLFTIAGWSKTALVKSANDLRDKRLFTFDDQKVARVELAAKGQTIEFGRNAQNEWQIVKPLPARADNLQVEELVRKLKEARMDLSAIVEPGVFASAAPVAVARATDASGTQQIDVRKRKEDTFYARSSAVEGVHKVSKELGEAVAKGLDDYRTKKLFDFGFTDPSRLEFQSGGKTTVLAKAQDKWTKDGVTMDSIGVQGIVDKLRELTALKFAASGFATPVFEATVVSGDGKHTEKMQVSKVGNFYYARRDGEPAQYELDGKSVTDLEEAIANLRPAAPPNKNTPAKK